MYTAIELINDSLMGVRVYPDEEQAIGYLAKEYPGVDVEALKECGRATYGDYTFYVACDFNRLTD